MVEDFLIEVKVSESVGITSIEASGPNLKSESRGDDDMMLDVQEDIVIRRSKTQAFVK